MGWKTEFSTIVFEDIRVELECHMEAAEPDVGIMGDYCDDWRVLEVDGNTDPYACNAMAVRIQAELGDDKFVEQLYDEGLGCD